MRVSHSFGNDWRFILCSFFRSFLTGIYSKISSTLSECCFSLDGSARKSRREFRFFALSALLRCAMYTEVQCVASESSSTTFWPTNDYPELFSLSQTHRAFREGLSILPNNNESWSEEQVNIFPTALSSAPTRQLCSATTTDPTYSVYM